MFESDDPVEKKQIAPFQLSVRVVYLLLAVSIILANFYFIAFPGSTKDERFERFMFWGLSLYLSAFLAAPVLLFLFWKLIKGETDRFWTIAFWEILYIFFCFLYSTIRFAVDKPLFFGRGTNVRWPR